MQIYKLLLYKNEKNYIIKMEFCVITRKCLKNAYSKMYVTFAGECQNDFSRMLQDAIFQKRERRGKMKKKRMLLLAAMFVFTFAFIRFNTVDVQAASKYTIYVNRRTNLVNVTNSKTGKLVKAMYCSTGRNYRTIRGTYNTTAKYKWRPLIHGVYGQYSTRIHGAYLFHSVPYYSINKSQVSTEEYNKLGQQASAGCIRLAVTDAKWIYDHCRLGTKVVIGEGRTLKKPTRPKVRVSTKKRAGWDPTDPDSRNPYRPKLTLKKKATKTIVYGSTFNIKNMVNVSSSYASSDALLKSMKVKGKVNTKKAGTYKVQCTITDPYTAVSVTKTFTFKVGKKPKQTTTEKKAPTELTTEEKTAE